MISFHHRHFTAATLAALLLAGPLRSSASIALPPGAFTLRADSGFDSEVLSDPTGLGVVDAVDAPFASAAFDFHLSRLGPATRKSRFRTGVRASLTRYGNDGPKSDTDLRGHLSWERRIDADLLANLRAEIGRFRRADLPLFDWDFFDIEGTLTRPIGERWYGGAGGTYTLLDYPGRLIDNESGDGERDHRTDGRLFLVRRLSPTAFLEGSATWRSNASNDTLAEYDGPIMEVRTAFGRPERLRMLIYASAALRSYPSYPLFEASGDTLVQTTGHRKDTTIWFGAVSERTIRPRLSLLVDIALLHQTSNVSSFEFDQVRVTAGVRVDLWRKEASAMVAAATPPLAPVRAASGRVLFLCRAPRAGKVILVGGWNGWRADLQPMSGPDEAGIWRIEVDVPEGTWRYAFIIDGEWVKPEGAMRYEADGFGGVLGILDGGL